MFLPVRGAQLVADQAIRRFLVRNAQQCLGEAHEHDAFLAGKLVLLHERVDAALADAMTPHFGDQRTGALGDARAHALIELGGIEKGVDDLGLVASMPVGDRLAQ